MPKQLFPSLVQVSPWGMATSSITYISIPGLLVGQSRVSCSIPTFIRFRLHRSHSIGTTSSQLACSHPIHTPPTHFNLTSRDSQRDRPNVIISPTIYPPSPARAITSKERTCTPHFANCDSCVAYVGESMAVSAKALFLPAISISELLCVDVCIFVVLR